MSVEANVYLITLKGIERVNADVYIHVKGYSLARVTHLDIESPKLNEIMPPGASAFLPVIGTSRGFKVDFSRVRRGVKLLVESDLLAGRLLRDGERTWAYVGGKVGGIFIGFRKEYVVRLEDIAVKHYGLKPRSRGGS